MVDRHRFMKMWPLTAVAIGVVVYVVVSEFLR